SRAQTGVLDLSPMDASGSTRPQGVVPTPEGAPSLCLRSSQTQGGDFDLVGAGWCAPVGTALKGWAKNPSPSQRMESLLQSRELHGVRDIVVSRAWRRALRRRDGSVRLTATPHGNDAGAHHFQYTIRTQHFNQSIDLVFRPRDFDGQGFGRNVDHT